MGMKKKRAISIAVLAVLAVLALAVLQGRLSREVILKRNGLPLANLKGSILPSMPDRFGIDFHRC